MPTFYQTAGPNSDTLRCNDWNSNEFTVLWRAKDKKYRARIAAIAKAAVNGPAVKYNQGRRGEVYNAIAKGTNYAARYKIAQKKLGGKCCDCSAFASACCKGAGASIGLQTSASIASGNFSKFTKHSYSKVKAAGTWQRGDIVAKGNFHAAVIAYDGPNCKTSYKNFYSDGSQKIKSKKVNEIRNKYIKNNKKNVKKNDTAKKLQAYIKDLKKQRTTIKNKIKNQKKKKKTKAIKKYIKQLEKTRDKLTKSIEYAEKQLQELKNKKTTKSGANKSRPKDTQTQITNTSEEEYDDEQISADEYAVDGSIEFDEEEDTPDMEENQEPVIISENVNYYYLRSGPNYFSPLITNSSIVHKDYLGKSFCKRKVKIKTITTEQNEWIFTFDRNFNSCSAKSANIQSMSKDSSGNSWKVTLNTVKEGQIAMGVYTFTLKTQDGLEYEFLCQIDTFYDV